MSLDIKVFEQKKDWIKIWSGKFSLQFDSHQGIFYTRKIIISGEPVFSKAIYFYKNGVSECWVTKKDKDLLGSRLINLLQKDRGYIGQLVAEQKKYGIEINQFMDTNAVSVINLSKYSQFWELVRLYYLQLISIKYIVDYLPSDEMKIYLPILQEARKLSEPVSTRIESYVGLFSKEIAEKVNLSQEEILSSTKDELEDYLSKGNLPTADLKSRFKSSCLVFNKEDYLLKVGDDVKEVEDIVLNKEETKIKNKNWWKFWSLNFSLLNASMLGKNYMRFMKDQIGTDCDNVIFVSKEGHSTCFWVEEERKKYGEFLVGKYAQNGDVSKLCRILKEKTDAMFATMKELKDTSIISKQQYKKFLEQSYDYNGFYTVPRAIIDYIDKSLVDHVIKDLTDVRKHSEPIYGMVEEVTRKYAAQISKEVSKEAGYKQESVLCLLIDEFEEYLDTGKLPPEKDLQRRWTACGLIFNKKETILTLDPEEINQLENINVTVSEKREMEGSVAFKGYAKGVVRIVHDPFKCKTFNEGDVLVTGMTRPEFVPLMEKAGAIVTDAGGLLCHAAIVARELRKPCIIGTQVATKVLKDGDFVEVDAELGVVRKIV